MLNNYSPLNVPVAHTVDKSSRTEIVHLYHSILITMSTQIFSFSVVAPGHDYVAPSIVPEYVPI